MAAQAPISYPQGSLGDKRQRLETLRVQLYNERSSFLEHWKDIGDFISPRRQRYFTSDTNRGNKRHSKIIDSSATTAARTLTAGIMSGLTSPAREWFRVGVADPALVADTEVKLWCDEVTRIVRMTFNSSNLYQNLPNLYNDCATFATAAMYAEEDIDDVIRFRTFPIGSYAIACDPRGYVCVFFREYRMTVRQVVMKFQKAPGDWSNISDTVKQLWDGNNKDTWIDIYHCIYPNEKYDPKSADPRKKKYCSDYWEKGTTGQATNGTPLYGSDGDREKFLRESGYDIFPVMVSRWQVDDDVYGIDCPGMLSLGDVKQLQTAWKRYYQALEKSINPPMKAPEGFKSQVMSTLAGGMTWTQEGPGSGKFEPAHVIDPRFAEILKGIAETKGQIHKIWFEDIFMMISMDERTQPPTAEEIIEKRSEKMNILGPVVQQFDKDLLTPLIQITFNFLERLGKIPEPPDVLKGKPLQIDYISIMNQAQKILGVGNKERFTGFVIRQSTEMQNPALLDNIDFDNVIREYGDALGIEQKNMRSPEQVAQIRAERAQAQQAQQQTEIAESASKSALNLAKSDMSGDTALTRLLGNKEAELSPTI